MTIEKVNAIPKRTKSKTGTTNNKIKKTADNVVRIRSTFSAMRRRINAIMDAGCKYGKITFESDEYGTSKLGYQSLRSHAIVNDLPIEFTMRGSDLYFTRLDMKD